MKIKVYYPKRGREDELELMAEVDAAGADSIELALEFAFYSCQNVEGSWSRGELFNGRPNPDYSRAVRVIKPLECYDRIIYGHRSSMVGDVFEIGDVRYRVASYGFEEIEREIV